MRYSEVCRRHLCCRASLIGIEAMRQLSYHLYCPFVFLGLFVEWFLFSVCLDVFVQISWNVPHGALQPLYEWQVCVGTELPDTALSSSPPPQAASITLSAVAVQVVRRTRGCLAAMLRLQGATYCTRLTMEESYSWPWAVPEVSAKKRQSQQGKEGSLSCGSDDGCRRAGVAGALSCADCAIRQRQAVKGSLECAPRCAASAPRARRYRHRAHPKHPVPGASWYALPPTALPEPGLVVPTAGRRR